MPKDKPQQFEIENQNAERRYARNTLGNTSLILSIIALCIGIFASVVDSNLESRKIPNKQYQTDDATIITDKASNSITFMGRVVVFLVGGLIGGTLALVALFLGCVALARPRRTTAAIGVILSLLTFKIMLG